MPVNPRSGRTSSAVLVFLIDEDSFLSEQDDVFVTEHGSGAASAAGYRQGSRDGCGKRMA